MAKPIFTAPYPTKIIEEGIIPDSLISLPIKGVNGWQNIWFILDSGADTTMLSVGLAEQLGLPYDRTKPTNFLVLAIKV